MKIVNVFQLLTFFVIFIINLCKVNQLKVEKIYMYLATKPFGS